MQTTLDVVVRDKGSDELISVPASATVAEAVAAMTEREVGAVLIMNEDGLVSGIFTERDVVVRVVKQGRDPKTTPISMVMTRDVTLRDAGHDDRGGARADVRPPLPPPAGDRRRRSVHGLVSMRDLAYQLIRHGEGRFEAAVRLDEGAAP